MAATNVDSHPVGTSLRDFVRGNDGSPMPEDVVQEYDKALSAEGYWCTARRKPSPSRGL
jgi:hypothetical protein